MSNNSEPPLLRLMVGGSKDTPWDFVKFLAWTTLKRLGGVFLWLKTFGARAVVFAERARSFAIRKLLWKRGVLFRPLSHLSLFGLAAAVLVFAPMVNAEPSFAGWQEEAPTDFFVKPISAETKTASGFLRNEKVEYEVVPGDTLTSVGERFKVSISSLCATNNLSDCDTLSIGQQLTIPPMEDSILVQVKKGETVEKLASRYKVDPQSIVDANYLFKPFALEVGQELVIPGATVPRPTPSIPSYFARAPITPSGPIPEGSGRFVWPTAVRTVSQYFNRWHPALDIPQPKNGPVLAADAGRVIRAGWWPVGYGYAVQIDHGNGYVTSYAHLSKVAVRVGQDVDKGEAVGTMGATGRAYGQHVHFMIQQNGRYLNPLDFFK